MCNIWVIFSDNEQTSYIGQCHKCLRASDNGVRGQTYFGSGSVDTRGRSLTKNIFSGPKMVFCTRCHGGRTYEKEQKGEKKGIQTY